MSKYHINNEGKIGVCKASKRPCRFGNANSHYSSKESALVAQAKKKSMPKTQQRNLPPIITEKIKMLGPEFWNTYPQEIKINLINGEKRINVSEAIESITNCDRKVWPKAILNSQEELDNKWNNKNKWRGRGNVKTPPEGLINDLQKLYYSENNAIDSLGVLEHVREKGFDTSNLTPIEAIKKMLRHENAKYVPFVENATRVECRNLDFSKIHEARKHYERIESSEPIVKSSRSREITGIVFETPNGEMRLLDGHHRYKFKKESGKKNGLFIILLP